MAGWLSYLFHYCDGSQGQKSLKGRDEEAWRPDNRIRVGLARTVGCERGAC